MLCELTGKQIEDIPLNDPKVFDMINDITTLGIAEEQFPYKVGSWALPELGTNFTIQMLEELKPKNMSEMIYFAGLSHGTAVWNGNGQDLFRAGKNISEIISTRDRLYDFLCECGMSKGEAFKTTDLMNISCQV